MLNKGFGFFLNIVRRRIILSARGHNILIRITNKKNNFIASIYPYYIIDTTKFCELKCRTYYLNCLFLNGNFYIIPETYYCQ